MHKILIHGSVIISAALLLIIIIIIIIIIIYIALNSRTGSVQKRSEEKNPSGFEFGVFHPPGSCLTRLMRPPPQDLISEYTIS